MRQDHEGIKLCLKPIGPDLKSTKFIELPLNSAKSTSHHMECSISKFKGSFAIMLDLTDKFEMPDGSALLVEITMQNLTGTGKSGTHKFIIGARAVDVGNYMFSGNGEPSLTTAGFKNVYTNLSVPLQGNEAKNGTIRMTFTQFHSNWTDRTAGRYGCDGPRKSPTWANMEEFLPLDGELGRPFEFVFRPLAKAAYHKAAQKHLHVLPADLIANRVGFTQDEDFEAASQAADRKYEDMCTAWDKKQAEIASESSITQGTLLNPANNGVQTPLSSPGVVHQALSTSRLNTAPEIRNGRPGATRPGAPPATKEAKQSRPVICTCPTEHQTVRERPAKSKDTDISPGSDSPAAQPKQSSRPNKAGKTKETSVSEPPETSKEIATVACGQCKQIKDAPRGKKLAFRQARGRYMFVPQDAPGDDDIEDEAPNNQVPQVDEDDVEALAREEQEVMEALQSGFDTPGLGPPDVPLADIGVVPQPGAETPETQTQQSTTNEIVTTPATRISATVDAEVVVMSQVTIEDSEVIEATPTTETIATPRGSEIPLTTMIGNEVASELQIEEHEGATESSTAEQIVTQQDAAEPPEETNNDAPAHDSAPTEPPTVTPAAGSTESRKRAATPANETRDPKRQRVKIDLTNDEDDDIVHVKEESMTSPTTKAAIRLDGTKEKWKLQAELRELQIRRKQLDLEMKEAKLLHKLAQLDD